MHMKICNLLLVSLTLGFPLESLARAIPDPASISVRSLKTSDILQSGHIFKRVDIIEPGPEPEPVPEPVPVPEEPGTSGPGRTGTDPADPSNPQSNNPQDVPDPANIAGAGTGTAPAVQAPNDPITGGPLSSSQALARGTDIDTKMGNIPAGAADKALPDMSAYDFTPEEPLDASGVEELKAFFEAGELGLSDGTFQRTRVASRTPPTNANADELPNGIVNIIGEVKQGLLVVPWMNKAIDGNPAAEQRFVSDLLKKSWTDLAGSEAGGLKTVFQENIVNTATQEIIRDLSPNSPKKVVEFEANTDGFKQLMGTDNAIVSNRMLLDYPATFGHKTATSIKTWWTDDDVSSSGSDSDEQKVDGYQMWISYQ